jgi:acyl-[acyl-carrier-protein]-phospholipid O-acyltransferase/long-chain-fatty-acid--[acyl-carrier-protein] ligase
MAADATIPTTMPAVLEDRRSFWSLFSASFQEAFNDLAFRTLVTFFVLGIGLSQTQRDALVSLTLLLFALPFILFSMLGGYFADRYSKRSVTLVMKAVEVCSMAVGVVALAYGNVGLLLLVVFLVSAQSAVFGPSKWGMLPEVLPESRLSWGNGLLQFGTYVAAIVGTIAGGFLSETFQGRKGWAGAVLMATAALGVLVSLALRRLPAANPHRKLRIEVISDLVAQMRLIRRDRTLALAVLGNGYFLFLATLLQANILRYGKDVLALGDTQNGYLQAAVAIGIGLGSLTAGYVSGNKIEYGLIPLGSLGLVGFSAVLSQPGLTFGAVLALLGMLGFSGGFFIVPIGALIQHRPPPEQRGGVIAAANWLSWVGAFLAAGADYLLASVGLVAPPGVFLIGAAITLAGTVYVVRLLPDALLRLLLWMLTNTLYRVRVLGRENLPEKGGALLVPNHLSRIDALLLIASTDRHIRFLMDKEWYEKQFIKPFAKMLRVIPISSQQRPRELLQALRVAGEAIRAGEVVCVFAEGQITRLGRLLPFRRGFERIMKGSEGKPVDAPIIPVLLDNVWGSIFSFERGKFLWKRPYPMRRPVIVSYGPPMPPDATAGDVRRAIQTLHSDAYQHHREWLLPLHRAWLRAVRRHPLRFAMGDARIPRLRSGAALLRTLYLARRLRPVWRDQEMVGILLPPSVGGALVNFAAMLLGKVPVNLNYTASSEVLASCAAQCGLRTVVTSKAFLEKVKLEVPGEMVVLEEVAARPRLGERLAALLLAGLPTGWMEKLLGRARPAELDDLASVIFSSGSTGTPKGVLLTHFNIAANIEQVRQIVLLYPRDRLLGVLPFFHSMGFTVGLWLPPIAGVGVVYHPNPVEAKAIGALVRQYGITLMVATPTFLQTYTRRCAPEDFGSLRFVLAGAEKLPERVARSFEDQFGLRVLEGYGCTECAPVVAANTGDYRAPGFRQVGAKRGKIGHPVPGLAVRIVDPETGKPLPVGKPGLLLVRGPNVMQGYLGLPEKTAAVLRDGWYETGDIAYVDEDGFLEITDRQSRFSKIGGEMIPHVKVEETLQGLIGIAEQAFVVLGVPDARKGERLVVLHTLDDAQLQECLARMASSGLPNLWRPDARQFFRLEAFPYLGTGKLDMNQLRKMALQFSQEP